MKRSHLLKQSTIRASAMIVVKMMGLIGRVDLTRLIGAEGIGIYQIAYSFYGFSIMILGGFPTALAIITAKRSILGWHFLKILILCIILSGSIISLAVFHNSTHIADLLGSSGLEYAIRSLAPAIFAAPLLGLLRGYLQGLEKFSIIAASEVIEQGCRVLTMLVFVYYMLPRGIDQAIGGGIYGTFIGVFITFAILAIYILVDQKKQVHSSYESYRLPFVWFFRTSVIISFTRILIPASEFIDAILIPGRLISAGHSSTEAISMYGIITGMATVVAYAPTLITGALSHTITMRLAGYWHQKKYDNFHHLLQISFNIVWLWGLISGTFIFAYAKEISLYIFNTEDAYLPIKYLAFIPLIVGFREISTSILWSQDVKKVPFFGLALGICCSIVVQFILIGLPGFGYIGAAAGILTMELISSAWNLRALNIRKDVLFRMNLLFILDIVIFYCIMMVSYLFIHSYQEVLQDLTIFLMGGGLFFLLSGIYMYLRCVALSQIHRN